MKNNPILSPEAAAAALRSVAFPDIAAVEDVAAMVKLSPSAVRAHFRSGRIPGRKLGRRWLTTREIFFAWLAERASTPPDAPPSSTRVPGKALRLIRGQERLKREGLSR